MTDEPLYSDEESLDSIQEAVDELGWAEGTDAKLDAIWKFVKAVNEALRLRQPSASEVESEQPKVGGVL